MKVTPGVVYPLLEGSQEPSQPFMVRTQPVSQGTDVLSVDAIFNVYMLLL